MLNNKFFGLKGSTVLSSKDGNLSHRSHQRSGRNLSSLITKLALCIMVVSMTFTSCTKDDDDFPLVEEQQQLKSSDAMQTQATVMSTPTGWTDQGTNTAGGIRRYYNSSKKWYVIKVFLPEIRLTPMYRITAGSGTSNPTFEKKSLSTWLNDDIKGLNSIMLINASFFDFKGSSTGQDGPLGTTAKIAHRFGYSNSIISSGFSSESGQKQLRIYNQLAYIENPISANFETLVTGLDISVDKEKYKSIGRTVAGIPSNGNNTMYFFVTGNGGGATQAQAQSALQSFGCTQFVMFDGSGSSQMSWGSSMLVNSSDLSTPVLMSRRIPVFLRMYRR